MSNIQWLVSVQVYTFVKVKKKKKKEREGDKMKEKPHNLYGSDIIITTLDTFLEPAVWKAP